MSPTKEEIESEKNSEILVLRQAMTRIAYDDRSSTDGPTPEWVTKLAHRALRASDASYRRQVPPPGTSSPEKAI